MTRRLLIVPGLIIVFLVVAYALGPRHAVKIDDSALQLPATTAELEEYLHASEARAGDVLANTEKTVLFAHEDRRRTPLALIYLHGFSATRQEVAPLCEQLAKELGANLFMTRLSGHGQTPKAMGDVNAGDWLRDTLEAYEIGRLLGDRVIIIGASTGGTLALWLAERAPQETLAALLLISPNLGPRDPRAEWLAGPWGRQLAELLLGNEYRWTPSNELHARYWNSRYPTRALVPMMALVKEVRASDLESIAVPTLVVYSPADRVVDPQKIAQGYQRLGRRTAANSENKLLPFADSQDPSSHVLAGDILAPRDTARVRTELLNFLVASGVTSSGVATSGVATTRAATKASAAMQ